MCEEVLFFMISTLPLITKEINVVVRIFLHGNQRAATGQKHSHNVLGLASLSAEALTKGGGWRLPPWSNRHLARHVLVLLFQRQAALAVQLVLSA